LQVNTDSTSVEVFQNLLQRNVDRMFLVALFLLTYAAITYALFERASRRLTEWMPGERTEKTMATSWPP
jgi:hypothetical protein